MDLDIGACLIVHGFCLCALLPYPLIGWRNEPVAGDIVGGRRFQLDNKVAYLHRGTADGLQDSTLAYLGSTDSNCAFIEKKHSLLGNECHTPLKGFDTFWYNWSLNNPDTELLGQK